ncbi:hypothetical protein P13BB106kb_p011 [Pectobacterium phage DU_PP_V]|uniref:Uncharacterized protein n=1 Tax=Pectobacterium phage DU_PP_V TaxID=2041492 RepID=A0A2D2W6S2_9CAUD|nr:hypothetical protein HOS40_gp011 [Pectobacterium phage DU_PP_V]ATS93995.1 hypothetical protein P13BB106kb_p011 [Pectobacterium phage DU_PP_V]
MGLSSTDYRNSVSAPSIADRPLIGLLVCTTGYCGSDSMELIGFAAGENLDEFAHEQAIENASSFGYEGDNVCIECGEVSGSDTSCDSCGSDDLEWQENDNVCGTIYLFNPSYHMGYTAGGDDESALVRQMFAIDMLVQDGSLIRANTSMIVNGMAGEHNDIIRLVDGFIRSASYLYGTFTRIVWE